MCWKNIMNSVFNFHLILTSSQNMLSGSDRNCIFCIFTFVDYRFLWIYWNFSLRESFWRFWGGFAYFEKESTHLNFLLKFFLILDDPRTLYLSLNSRFILLFKTFHQLDPIEICYFQIQSNYYTANRRFHFKWYFDIDRVKIFLRKLNPSILRYTNYIKIMLNFVCPWFWICYFLSLYIS